ncbi:MAG: hypothetical protein KAS77_10245, partial [Thermoplasmata archaeon]|nr:hypothetical protein [Thermoplasmata archaeon]
MGSIGTTGLALLALALALLMAATPVAVAEGTYGTYLVEDGYTSESTTTNRFVELQGKEIVRAWFNFTFNEDVINSDPDSFLVRVSNRDDASVVQNLPGTTDVDGRLKINIPFTREASPRWDVSVTCTDAGDTTLGPSPIVIEEDTGNGWSLQVEYYYTTDDGGNGGEPNNGGNGGGGDDDQPVLVTIFEINLVIVALLSLLVAFLALQAWRGEGGLRMPLVFALIIAVDAFFTLPIAILVNLELNDAIIGVGPFGPEWLGTLAIVLLVIWLIP